MCHVRSNAFVELTSEQCLDETPVRHVGCLDVAESEGDVIANYGEESAVRLALLSDRR